MDQHQQKPAVVRRFESDGYRIFSDELEYILQRRCLAGYADSDSRSRGVFAVAFVMRAFSLRPLNL